MRYLFLWFFPGAATLSQLCAPRKGHWSSSGGPHYTNLSFQVCKPSFFYSYGPRNVTGPQFPWSILWNIEPHFVVFLRAAPIFVSSSFTKPFWSILIRECHSFLWTSGNESEPGFSNEEATLQLIFLMTPSRGMSHLLRLLPKKSIPS